MSDSDDVVMLTLTAPPPMAGLGRGALESAIARQREMWRETTTSVRWWKWRRDRRKAGKLEPPRLDDGCPHPGYTTTFDDVAGEWSGPELEDGYAWGLEVTTGGDGKQHWHVHRHILCSSLAVAERINAAWQLAARSLGIRGRGWARTDITSMPSGAAAYYLAAYISSKNEPSQIPPRCHRDYTRVMRDTQRHNAGGACRPLGIGRPRSDDQLVAVHLPGYGPVEPCELFGGSDVLWESVHLRTSPDDWRLDDVDAPATPERVAWLAEIARREFMPSAALACKHHQPDEPYNPLIYKGNPACGPPA